MEKEKSFLTRLLSEDVQTPQGGRPTRDEISQQVSMKFSNKVAELIHESQDKELEVKMGHVRYDKTNDQYTYGNGVSELQYNALKKKLEEEEVYEEKTRYLVRTFSNQKGIRIVTDVNGSIKRIERKNTEKRIYNTLIPVQFTVASETLVDDDGISKTWNEAYSKNTNVVEFRRDVRRSSYTIGDWRLDVSLVVSTSVKCISPGKYPSGSFVSFEVEMEYVPTSSIPKIDTLAFEVKRLISTVLDVMNQKRVSMYGLDGEGSDAVSFSDYDGIVQFINWHLKPKKGKGNKRFIEWSVLNNPVNIRVDSLLDPKYKPFITTKVDGKRCMLVVTNDMSYILVKSGGPNGAIIPIKSHSGYFEEVLEELPSGVTGTHKMPKVRGTKKMTIPMAIIDAEYYDSGEGITVFPFDVLMYGGIDYRVKKFSERLEKLQRYPFNYISTDVIKFTVKKFSSPLKKQTEFVDLDVRAPSEQIINLSQVQPKFKWQKKQPAYPPTSRKEKVYPQKWQNDVDSDISDRYPSIYYKPDKRSITDTIADPAEGISIPGVEDDGYIFYTQGDSNKYKLPYETPTYKWKPPGKLTIDFLIKGVIENPDNLGNEKYQLKLNGGNYKTMKRFIPNSVDFGNFEVITGTVGEFNISKDNVYTLVRYRFDKSGGNHITVAENVLADIKNPISTDTILGKDLFLMRKFHNTFKMDMIKRYASNKTIVDIGSGRGGDLSKWMKCGVRNVIAIEPNDANLSIFKDRLSKIKRISTNFVFYPGGAQEADDIYEDPDIRPFFEASSFDRIRTVTSFFSLTYMYKNKEMFDGFIKLLDMMPPGTRFVGAMLDGTAVASAINVAEYSTKKRMIDNDAFSIEARYPESADIEREFGLEIVTNIKEETSMVKNQSEYLTSYPMLKEALEAQNWRSDLVHDCFIDKNYSPAYEILNENGRVFSSLNRYFVFTKLDADDTSKVMKIKENPEVAPKITVEGVTLENGLKYDATEMMTHPVLHAFMITVIPGYSDIVIVKGKIDHEDTVEEKLKLLDEYIKSKKSLKKNLEHETFEVKYRIAILEGIEKLIRRIITQTLKRIYYDRKVQTNSVKFSEIPDLEASVRSYAEILITANMSVTSQSESGFTSAAEKEQSPLIELNDEMIYDVFVEMMNTSYIKSFPNSLMINILRSAWKTNKISPIIIVKEDVNSNLQISTSDGNCAADIIADAHFFAYYNLANTYALYPIYREENGKKYKFREEHIGLFTDEHLIRTKFSDAKIMALKCIELITVMDDDIESSVHTMETRLDTFETYYEKLVSILKSDTRDVTTGEQEILDEINDEIGGFDKFVYDTRDRIDELKREEATERSIAKARREEPPTIERMSFSEFIDDRYTTVRDIEEILDEIVRIIRMYQTADVNGNRDMGMMLNFSDIILTPLKIVEREKPSYITVGPSPQIIGVVGGKTSTSILSTSIGLFIVYVKLDLSVEKYTRDTPENVYFKKIVSNFNKLRTQLKKNTKTKHIRLKLL